MKLNWGHKILISFILFVGLILYMVVRSYQNNHDLVAENYYEREIEYQGIIDKREKTTLLKSNIKWTYEQTGLKIIYPEMEEKISGSIVLFRPSDKNLDMAIEILADENNIQLVSSDLLEKGKYLIEIEWQSGNGEYYTEGSVFIDK